MHIRGRPPRGVLNNDLLVVAGNFPGQGVVYPIMFTGLNIQDFSFPATKENAESGS